MSIIGDIYEEEIEHLRARVKELEAELREVREALEGIMPHLSRIGDGSWRDADEQAAIDKVAAALKKGGKP